jgi:hypothetical protein
MAKANAAEAKVAKQKAEVDGYIHAAVLKLATSGGPLKLQSKKGEADWLFPSGSAGCWMDSAEKWQSTSQNSAVTFHRRTCRNSS